MGGGDRPFLATVLAKPHAAIVRAVLKNSVRYQQPPSAWFGRDGTWTDRDRLLTIAYTLYEATLCSECGRTVEECSSNAYQVHTRTCNATAAIERWRKEHKKPPPGQVLSVERIERTGGINPTIASAPDWWKEQNGYNPDGSPKEGG